MASATPGGNAAPPAAARAHRARLEIDLDAIAANWRALDALGPAQTGAAIKADGYGMGAAQVAPALFAAGCRLFFTATEEEAVAAADALGPSADATLLVLNGFDPQAAPRDLRIGPVLNTIDDAQAWSSAGGDARPAALQVETGMRRLGIDGLDQPGALDALAATLAAGPLRPMVTMSHLAVADAPTHPLNARQRARFERLAPALRNAFPAAKTSLAATGGALLGPDFAFDLIRPGIGLYGGAPFAAARPVVRLSAPILQLADVAIGESSGYGASWTAQRPSRLATIPLGYADGLPRALGGKGRARIGAGIAPVAGRISMDLIVLDVTDITPAPRLGDRAWLLDDSLTVDALAAAGGTIGYEILTGLGAQLGTRAERLYLGAAGRRAAGT